MKRLVRTKTFWAAAAAVILTAGLSVQSTMAYFTTYVTAKGGYEITLGSRTEIEEDVDDMTKHITLSNTGETECYVRVKVFCGSQIDITYSGAVDSEGTQYWTLADDGYWYYKDILQPKESTEVLLAKIELPEEFTESFNVIVVQECTPVKYTADGTAYADWSVKADTKTNIGEAEVSGSDLEVSADNAGSGEGAE